MRQTVVIGSFILASPTNRLYDWKVTNNKIATYEVDLGTDFVSPLNPATGHSVQQINHVPLTDGPVPTEITVHASDASGNIGQAKVQFQEIYKGFNQCFSTPPS